MNAPLRIVYNPYPDCTCEHADWNTGQASETCPPNSSLAFCNGFQAGQHNKARRKQQASFRARHNINATQA